MEVTVAEMKEIEFNANEKGLSYTEMMENAGTGAGKLLLEKLKGLPDDEKTAVIFCGTGNNGGDGFVVARFLKNNNWDVLVVLVGEEPKTVDAILNFDRARELDISIIKITDLKNEKAEKYTKAAVLVDAIYGTGFKGELRPSGKLACHLINSARGKVFSLDLPSGVEADTGKAAEGAVKADITATFHATKPCHRLNPQHCGETHIVSIGAEKIGL